MKLWHYPSIALVLFSRAACPSLGQLDSEHGAVCDLGRHLHRSPMRPDNVTDNEKAEADTSLPAPNGRSPGHGLEEHRQEGRWNRGAAVVDLDGERVAPDARCYRHGLVHGADSSDVTPFLAARGLRVRGGSWVSVPPMFSGATFDRRA